MKNQTIAKSRKELELKLEAALSDKIQMLSKELQHVLLDDLVTAFENRLNVLNRTQTNIQFSIELTECVRLETI